MAALPRLAIIQRSNYDDTRDPPNAILAWWLIAIIVWLAVVVVLFWSSLIFHCYRAFCFATGLWLVGRCRRRARYAPVGAAPSNDDVWSSSSSSDGANPPAATCERHSVPGPTFASLPGQYLAVSTRDCGRGAQMEYALVRPPPAVSQPEGKFEDCGGGGF
ncbi:hypothetical protein F4810DRAFT_712230 [Camillea tinctor]|nr:hypothetical protein F4810DRAFT_712230 [Camillea tinctor]